MNQLLFITNTFPINGSLNEGRFNYKAAEALSERLPLLIVHLRSWKPFRKLVDVKSIGGLKVIVFSFPFYPSQFPFLTGFQLLIYKRIIMNVLSDEFKSIKVIHSVGASFASVIASYISKKNKIPHIAQCIGTDVNYNLPKIKNTIGIKGMDNYVSYFTCNSFELEKQIRKLYPKVRTKTIYRGVDLDFFNSEEKILKENSKVIFTYLGGLSLRKETGKNRDYKGGETLLKAWSKLKKFEGKELNFVGPEVTTFLVDNILGGMHNSFNVNLAGILSREHVKDLLSRSDVIIIPSWAEGLPNVGMEALASSCALLGANVGGIPELIDNNGYLFDPGDINELVFLIEKICADIEILSELKIKSRYIAESKFDSKQFVEQYVKLYEEI